MARREDDQAPGDAVDETAERVLLAEFIANRRREVLVDLAFSPLGRVFVTLLVLVLILGVPASFVSRDPDVADVLFISTLVSALVILVAIAHAVAHVLYGVWRLERNMRYRSKVA